MQRFSGVLGSEYDLFPLSVRGGEAGYETFQQSTADTLVKALENSPSRPFMVIEGGCGSGHTSQKVVERMRGLFLAAIDNEPLMVDQAKERLSQYQNEVMVAQQDLHLFLQGCSSDGWDAFVSGFMLHNEASWYREAVIRQLGRVVKPGGVYVNGDKIAQNDAAAHAADLAEQMAGFEVFDSIGRPEVRRAWEKHYLEDDKIRFTEDEQRSLLEQAGFTDITFQGRVCMDVVVTARKG